MSEFKKWHSILISDNKIKNLKKKPKIQAKVFKLQFEAQRNDIF